MLPLRPAAGSVGLADWGVAGAGTGRRLSTFGLNAFTGGAAACTAFGLFSRCCPNSLSIRL